MERKTRLGDWARKRRGRGQLSPSRPTQTRAQLARPSHALIPVCHTDGGRRRPRGCTTDGRRHASLPHQCKGGRCSRVPATPASTHRPPIPNRHTSRQASTSSTCNQPGTISQCMDRQAGAARPKARKGGRPRRSPLRPEGMGAPNPPPPPGARRPDGPALHQSEYVRVWANEGRTAFDDRHVDGRRPQRGTRPSPREQARGARGDQGWRAIGEQKAWTTLAR